MPESDAGRNDKVRLSCEEAVEEERFLWKETEKWCGNWLVSAQWRKQVHRFPRLRSGQALRSRQDDTGSVAAGLRGQECPRHTKQCRTIAPMIAHLRGTVLAKHPNQAIVETQGVGYEVTISVPTFSEMPAAGSEVALHIHTHVREDALSLFGFLRLAEKHLFEKLLTVSGIGPKLAITILSGMPADEMVIAIRGGDLVRLTRIPGIGKKTAERMVLELRDKLPATTGATEVSAGTASPVEEDVISALVNLGYQRAMAEKALLAARAKAGASAKNFETLFREALGALSK